ncbi:MAG: heme NO-binding domain-containing protein [Blastocatellia bacterium]|nr:heme NO-binding domain-containing protein [Blastocatellia bacterium]
MKGMVFTEFLDMVEEKFGMDVADQMITSCDLPSGGAYTAVGTYDHQEIVQLVIKLSQLSGVALPDLLRAFGQHLFGRFVVRFPEMFEGIDDAFTFLQRIESHIHTEVRKLYPDADLPHFDCTLTSPGELVMVYRSNRGMADLAEGLINGCAAHYNEPLRIHREDISEGAGTGVQFTITHQRP